MKKGTGASSTKNGKGPNLNDKRLSFGVNGHRVANNGNQK